LATAAGARQQLDAGARQQLDAVAYSMLRVSDLSAESRALMADSQIVSSLQGLLCSFASPELEQQYEAESTGVLRLKVPAALACPLLARAARALSGVYGLGSVASPCRGTCSPVSSRE
jgi:hypothetical protein